MMSKILQLKIYLKGIKPQIWRRLLVSDFWSFDKLHKIIQKIMGWENYHLYEFNVNETKIALPVDDYVPEEEGDKDAKKTKLYENINSENQKFIYRYDFGNNWEHIIIVEKIMKDKIENQDKYPACIDGERACPPEDSGGISGYQKMLEIQKNKKHPHYKELIVGWLGEKFDSEKFNTDDVNKKLKSII